MTSPLPTSLPRLLTPLVLVAALVLAGCSNDAATDEEGGQDAPTISTAAVPADPQDGDAAAVTLVDTGASVDEPIALVPLSEGIVLIAERSGRIVSATTGQGGTLEVGDVVLDLRDRVGPTDAELGLLGIAVAPDGEHLYASYTSADDGSSQLDEYELSGSDGAVTADPDSRRNLLEVDQPFANHNGGHLEFGPDDMLYLGLGDGGSAGDPQGNSQDPTTLLGKIVRLDPRSSDGIPEDNPFVDDAEARPEIWATGVRNPWRFSFDATTGDLWVADVGQNELEEINRLSADEGAGRGANLGWDLFEGTQEFDDADPAPSPWSDGPFVEPVHTYGRDLGCSVTGGVVYRGSELASLEGRYLFADYCTPGIAVLDLSSDGATRSVLTDAPPSIISFGRDAAGEVYVLSQDDGIFRLSPG
jgi:glucose/arabinose dehydrogenase